MTASSSGSSCTVLYSTQTGRARACARRSARILAQQQQQQQHGFTICHGSTFDQLPNFIDFVTTSHSSATTHQDNKSSHFFLFFVSTTGEGEHCDTIQQTWKALLKKSLPKSLFQDISFALFALGDRAYGPLFCAAGRKLAVRLMQLGMKLQCEVGYGDDGTPNGGVFADLDRWIEQHLIPSLSSPSSSPKQQSSNTPISPSVISPLYNVIVDHSSVNNDSKRTTDPSSLEEWQKPHYANSYQSFFSHRAPLTAYSYHPKYGRHSVIIPSHTSVENTHPPLLLTGHVTKNMRLTPSDWEHDTRHIELRCLLTRPDELNGDKTEALVSSGPHHHPLPYQAGDVASILPRNSLAQVDKFLQTLPQSLQSVADCPLQISSLRHTTTTNQDTIKDQVVDGIDTFIGGHNAFWPHQCTLRGWLTYCADIHGLPEREDLRALSTLCSPQHDRFQEQRDMLLSLSETSSSALYVDFVLRNKRSWADVCFDFDSLRYPGSGWTMERLLTLLPPIRPRDFSIASAPSHGRRTNDRNHSFTIELCVAIVQGTTPLGRPYHGLCSHYLSELQPPGEGQLANAMTLWLRPGSFAGLPLERNSLSEDASFFQNPILCIGAGTGIAPMRSLILEREAQRQFMLSQETPTVDEENSNTTREAEVEASGLLLETTENLLIFGCRKATMDYYYQHDWETMKASGRLGVVTAFSREENKRVVYVQHRVKELSKEQNFIAKHILERNGAVYVAGNPKMARSVKEEILHAVSTVLGEGGEKKATLLFKKMQSKGRFNVEAWG